MSDENIFYGRTKEDAIRKAAEKFNVKKEKIDYEILEDETTKKTMFSILDNKKVKIKASVNKDKVLTKRDTSERKARFVKRSAGKIDENIEFLTKVLDDFKEAYKEQGFKYAIEKENDNISINIDLDKDVNKWVGYRGQTLQEFQNLLLAMLNSNFDETARVFLNIGGYKEERKAQLEKLADKVAKTVEKTGKKVTLEPMNSYERKIIHRLCFKF